MIVECPHCYNRVMAGPDGECPSCRRNVNDKTATDASMSSVYIAHLADVPPVCCGCGRRTDRYVKVRLKTAGDKAYREWRSSSLWLLILGTVCLAPVFLVLYLTRGSGRGRAGDTIVVRMPQCEACGAMGAPTPIAVDTEHCGMRFAVHVELKRRISDLLPRPEDTRNPQLTEQS